MSEASAAKRISLLRAHLIAMVSVAIVFGAIVLGVWVYTNMVIQREKSLVIQYLPELDASHRLTAATAGIQSQSLLLRTAQNPVELEQRRKELDDTIAATQLTIESLVITESGVRFGLEKAVESMASFVLTLADVKQSQIQLQKRINEETLRTLDMIDRIANEIQQRVVLLTEQLLERGELLVGVKPFDSDADAYRQALGTQLEKYDRINLAIQDYQIVIQDLVSLEAIVDSLPLLRDTAAVDIGLQDHELLISALVSRGIYIQDENSVPTLLLPLRSLRDNLRKPDNLFVMQKNLLALISEQDGLDQLMSEHTSDILEQTDQVRSATSVVVSDLAVLTLQDLERYRIVLVLLCLLFVCLLAGISYWLLYRNTVLPLVEITERFKVVGHAEFPEQAQQYYLQELSTLSEAMQQLDSVQKNMHSKDAQLQLINSDLKRANEELEQFAHIASHDLQEPLRKLQQFSNLLQEDYDSLLDDDGRFFLKTIRSSAKRMSLLIKETLAFSRTGSVNQVLERVDLAQVLSALVDEMDVAVNESAAAITIGTLPVVQANKLGMAQLFRNLLLNALKYRKPGTPAIISIDSVRCENSDSNVIEENTTSPAEGAGKLRIRIQDNGVGVAKKYQQRIFLPFERLPHENVPGTGLGLAMCRKVCESHGWDLTLSSEPDAGSLFEIHVPDKSVLVANN